MSRLIVIIIGVMITISLLMYSKSRLIVIIIGVMLCLATYSLVRRNRPAMDELRSENKVLSSGTQSLPAFDAHGVGGVQELKKSELINLMTQRRPLSPFENAQLDRGCPGLACLYQGLGLTRWPESARGTRAFLRLEDALTRSCPEASENFIFVKQAWWTSGKPPTPDPTNGEVPLSSVTRAKPGWYTFNYALYFPATKTYVWINHREYGFPANLLWPMKAYLSLLPPPLDENRPAQLYCSTCR